MIMFVLFLKLYGMHGAVLLLCLLLLHVIAMINVKMNQHSNKLILIKMY